MPQPDITSLNLSDEDLDRLAPITEQDIIIANRFVTAEVDPEFKNLLLTISQDLIDLEEESNGQ